MALSTVTITYDIADLVGADFDARRTKVYVTTNTDSVIDTEGNKIRVGDGLGTIASDGTGSVSVWAPGTGSNPATWQTYVHIDYAPRSPGAKRETLTYGPFTITASGDLADLVQEQVAIPTATAADYAADAEASADDAADSATASAASAAASASSASSAETTIATGVTAAQTARTGAETAQAGAEAAEAAAQALVLSDLGTTDGQTRALLENPLSQTAIAATELATPIAVAEAVKVGVPPVEGFLGKIAKAKTSPFRIASFGTSIQTFTSAPWRVLVETLKTQYGETSMQTTLGGLLGGSNDAASNGWKKQRYSGPYQIRSRGEASSTDQRFLMAGDRIEVVCSRETDSEAADIHIDGVVVGQTPAAGAQAYSQSQVFTVSSGVHEVLLKPPTGAGFVYFERVSAYDSTRTGVEDLNFTLGGSTLAGHVSTPAGEGAQVASIPVVGDNGVDSLTAIADLDAIHIGYVVNDAGSSPLGTGPEDPTSHFLTKYKPTMDKIVAATAAARIPLLLTIEMGGHYSMPNDAGNDRRNRTFEAISDYLRGLKVHNHVTVLDHHAATIMDDLDAYAARYYEVTGLNVAAGTYSGDFIHATAAKPGPRIGADLLHKMLGLPSPARADVVEAQSDRRRTLRPGEGRDVPVTIAGTTKRYPAAAGVGIQALSPDQFKRVPVMRDPSPTNLATAWATSLATPTGTDQWGAYKDMANVNQTLSAAVDWAGGATRLIVVRGSGNVAIRASSNAQLADPSGVTIPRTDVANNRTQIRVNTVPTGEEPIVFCVRVSASASGNLLDLSGRIYEAYILDTDVPVLLKDASAGAQGPTGATGNAGGFGSACVPGGWSVVTRQGSLGTATPTINDELMVEWVPKRSCTIDRLGVEVTTAGAAGAVARLGLRSSDTNGQPSALLVDAGTVDTTTTGFKESATFTPVAVVAGTVYWITCAEQTATSVLRVLGGFSTMLSYGNGAISGVSTYYVGGVTGALASSVSSPGLRGVGGPALRARVAS